MELRDSHFCSLNREHHDREWRPRGLPTVVSTDGDPGWQPLGDTEPGSVQPDVRRAAVTYDDEIKARGSSNSKRSYYFRPESVQHHNFTMTLGWLTHLIHKSGRRPNAVRWSFPRDMWHEQ